MNGRRKCLRVASAALVMLAPWDFVLLGTRPCQASDPASSVTDTGGHAKEYRFKLSPDGFAAVFGFDRNGVLDYVLPRSRVFERSGRLVLDLKEPKRNLSELLGEVTKEPKPLKKSSTLSKELSRLQGDDGRPGRGPDLDAADLSVVEYEAEWCLPCKEQLKKIREFAGANPTVRVNLVRVEADLTKLGPDLQKKLIGDVVEEPEEQPGER